MAKELALGLVIGGAVSASVKSAFKDVEGRVKKLETTASKARTLQGMIGETKRLQDEWRKAHMSGAAGADGLRKKLEANLDALRKQGVEVRNLGKAFDEQGRKARSAQLKATGHAQLKQGGESLKSTAVATSAAAAALVVPTKVSADYGAIIRDIAIKAGIAGSAEEAAMSKKVIDTSRESGMARNDVAEVVNALVGAGMDLKQAVEYAPVASKFVVGQGAEADSTAKMINALGQNAKITDPKDMQKALEAIAFQGQAGSFEAADMARWFPELLSKMANQGITGNDAVTQLGAMLQVQMKTAGSSDEAANNLKNWIEKIGSGDVVKAYKDAGIDYEKSMRTGLQNGKSTLESSFDLARQYVQTKDPKKAKEMDEAMAKVSKETDPKKAKEMMAALEASLRTGDLFADMQVKAALTAYMQNKDLYQKLKKDSAGASGILDKNLAERRETSSQKWKEAGQGLDDVMRSVGDSIRPATDRIADFITTVSKGVAKLSDESPNLVMGLVSAGAAIATVTSLLGTLKIAKGLFNIGRGALGGRGGSGSGSGAAGADADGDGKADGPKGKAAAVAAAVAAGVGAYRGKGKGEDGKDDAPKGAVGAAVAALSAFAEAGGGDDKGGADEVQKVFVTNAAALGAGSAPGAGADAQRRRGRRGRNSRRGPPAPPSPAPRPAPPPAPARSGIRAAGARLTSVASKVGGIGKAVPGGALLEAGMKMLETYQSDDKSKDEKAEGYGEAAGGLAGTLAGAAAGAAIGSVVPIIGTAIGGLIGGYLGGMGGESLGGTYGKKLFARSDEPAAGAPGSSLSTPLLMTPRPGPVVPTLASMGASFAAPGLGVTRNAGVTMPALDNFSKSLASGGDGKSGAGLDTLAKSLAVPEKPPAPKVEQSITLSPTFSVVVQGDVKDPNELVNKMMPEIERRLNDIGQQVARREMTDAPVF